MCSLLAGLWLVGAGVLSALNQLRHFAPTSIKPRLAAQLQQALQAVGGIMVRYHDPRGARETETTLFLAMCKAFIEVGPCPSPHNSFVDVHVVRMTQDSVQWWWDDDAFSTLRH